MSGTRLPFDDALDAAIDALQRGRPLDAVIADQGRMGVMLGPLLETAEAARQNVTRPPLSRALEHNYAIVQAAVERAQMAAAAQPHEPVPAPASWFKRRLTFASLSLPVGAVVAALTIGAAGAAASLVATDHGGVLGDLVSPVLPDAMVHGDDDEKGTAPAANNDGAPGSSGDTPGSENGPQETTVDGTITDINGNTFTLTVGEDEYLIQIDSNTEVAGAILEGGTAEVTGDLTAEKNLHAKNVDAQGGTPDDAGKPDDTGKPDDPGQPGDPPGSENQPDDPPGQSGDPPGSRSEGGGGTGGENSNNGNGGGSEKP